MSFAEMFDDAGEDRRRGVVDVADGRTVQNQPPQRGSARGQGRDVVEEAGGVGVVQADPATASPVSAAASMTAVAESAPTTIWRDEPRTANTAIGSSIEYRPVTTGIPAIFAYPRTSGMSSAASVMPASTSAGTLGPVDGQQPPASRAAPAAIPADGHRAKPAPSHPRPFPCNSGCVNHPSGRVFSSQVSGSRTVLAGMSVKRQGRQGRDPGSGLLWLAGWPARRSWRT